MHQAYKDCSTAAPATEDVLSASQISACFSLKLFDGDLRTQNHWDTVTTRKAAAAKQQPMSYGNGRQPLFSFNYVVWGIRKSEEITVIILCPQKVLCYLMSTYGQFPAGKILFGWGKCVCSGVYYRLLHGEAFLRICLSLALQILYGSEHKIAGLHLILHCTHAAAPPHISASAEHILQIHYRGTHSVSTLTTQTYMYQALNLKQTSYTAHLFRKNSISHFCFHTSSYFLVYLKKLFRTKLCHS